MLGLPQDVAGQASVESTVVRANTLYPVTVGVARVSPSPQQYHTLCNGQVVSLQFIRYQLRDLQSVPEIKPPKKIPISDLISYLEWRYPMLWYEE